MALYGLLAAIKGSSEMLADDMAKPALWAAIQKDAETRKKNRYLRDRFDALVTKWEGLGKDKSLVEICWRSRRLYLDGVAVFRIEADRSEGAWLEGNLASKSDLLRTDDLEAAARSAGEARTRLQQEEEGSSQCGGSGTGIAYAYSGGDLEYGGRGPHRALGVDRRVGGGQRTRLPGDTGDVDLDGRRRDLLRRRVRGKPRRAYVGQAADEGNRPFLPRPVA